MYLYIHIKNIHSTHTYFVNKYFYLDVNNHLTALIILYYIFYLTEKTTQKRKCTQPIQDPRTVCFFNVCFFFFLVSSTDLDKCSIFMTCSSAVNGCRQNESFWVNYYFTQSANKHCTLKNKGASKGSSSDAIEEPFLVPQKTIVKCSLRNHLFLTFLSSENPYFATKNLSWNRKVFQMLKVLYGTILTKRFFYSIIKHLYL